MISRALAILELAAENPRTILAKFRGAEARPYAVLTRPWVRNLGIRTTLDVGANVGHWAKACRLAIPGSAICSFEPIPACLEKLRTRMRNDASHKVYPFALGSEEGELKLHLHAHTASSSLLRETDEMRSLNQGSGTVRELSVPVKTLNELKDTEAWAPPFLLKLDVQGFELEVIKGASHLLPEIALIIAETSFRPLYKDQAIFSEIHNHLSCFGFSYCGSAGSVLRLSNGLEVQQDSIFINQRFLGRVGW